MRSTKLSLNLQTNIKKTTKIKKNDTYKKKYMSDDCFLCIISWHSGTGYG